ncbi:MAG: hypothetical protein E2576_14230 [Alcaligenaceae bacterium]|nr:hypothetical protein [Alcaligenaceae bacterium SAGV5]MPS55185.1 hypothetical protein [Alcaligenaceae bacterium SAGV3]MPT57876.1 hypothetical protein [Alcaligenaceae bacterium]
MSIVMPAWVRYGAVAAVAGIAVGLAQDWRYGERIAALERDLALRDAAAADSARKATEKVLSTQAGIQALFDIVGAEHQKEMENAKTDYERRIAAIGRGTVRLSIAARCPASGNPDGAIAATGAPETRAELEPAAGQALTAIAHDGDDAIRDLNACIDKYERARQKLRDVGLYNPVE